jgi:hypothetical protein
LWASSLPDGRERGAKEDVEVVAEGFVFGDSGFDGFLRGGTLVAEVDEGGEDVFCRGASGGYGGRGGGEVFELVFELDDEALGKFFADAGNAGERGVVLRAEGGDEAVGGKAALDGDGELGADARDGDKAFKDALVVAVEEAVEGEGVFADLGVDVERDFGAFDGERGVGGDADRDIVADASGFDDGLLRLLGEETSTEVRDHAGILQKRTVRPRRLRLRGVSCGSIPLVARA